MLTIPVPSHSAPSIWIHKYNFKTLRWFALIWLYVTKPLQSGLQFIFLLEGNSSWLDSTESSQGTLGWIILSHTKEKNRNMWSSESFRKPLSPQKLAFIKYNVSFSCFLWDSISLRSPDWPMPMQSSGLWVPGFFSLSSHLLSSIISTPRLIFALVIILVGNRWQSLVKGLSKKHLLSWQSGTNQGFSSHLYCCFGDFSQCNWARKRNDGYLDWKNRNKNIYVLGQQDSKAGNQACWSSLMTWVRSLEPTWKCRLQWWSRVIPALYSEILGGDERLTQKLWACWPGAHNTNERKDGTALTSCHVTSASRCTLTHLLTIN